MEEKKKNSGLFTIVLGAVLLVSIYIIVNKFIGSPVSTESKFTDVKSNNNPLRKKPDSILELGIDSPVKAIDSSKSTIKTVASEKLPSLDDVDAEMQKTINRVEKSLDRAYQLQPNNPNRIKLLQQTELIIDSAILAFENPFLNVMKGDLKMLQGENVKAVEAYESALLVLGSIASIERNHAGACYNAAIDLIRQNDTDRAIVLLEQFYNYDNTDENGRALLVDWYKKRAVGLLRNSENSEGLELAQKALALSPNDHVAHFNAGIALFRLLDYNKAIRKFKKCIELNPSDKFSKNYLYAIYMQKGDTANAALYETDATLVKIPVKQ